MKQRHLIGLALAAWFGAASSVRAASPVSDIANILSGTFHGSSPGNELRLDFRPVPSDPDHLFDLFIEISGTYLGGTVKRQGLIRLETQGQGVYVGYVPHFNPTVTALSPDVARFTESETNAACSFALAVAGDGFSGQTTGSTCSFALQGARGKWSVELEPGSIRLRNVESGETLRFRRSAK